MRWCQRPRQNLTKIKADRRCPLVIDFTYILSRLLHRVASMRAGGRGRVKRRHVDELRLGFRGSLARPAVACRARLPHRSVRLI
jgi:hypothetical protein